MMALRGLGAEQFGKLAVAIPRFLSHRSGGSRLLLSSATRIIAKV